MQNLLGDKGGIASDHAGFFLKEFLKEAFPTILWKDYGCYSEESTDYPDWISLLAKGVLKGEVSWGVAICGTGQGSAMTANRFRGIRAALCYNEWVAELARLHNNANILVLGARVVAKEYAKKILERFLQTPFEGGRHERRIKKLDSL